MKSRLLFAPLLTMLLASVAIAGHKPPPKPHTSTPTTTVTATADADSHSSSSSRAEGGNASATGGQGGHGGKGGNATQTQTAQGGAGGNATASNAGNEQHVNFEDVRELAQAPDAIAPNVYPSASCYYGASGGLSFGNSSFGAGLSGGKAKLDEACDIRETARSFAAIGNLHAANELLCATPAATKYLKNGCGDPAKPPEAAPTVLIVPTGVNEKDMKERERRIIEAVAGK